MCVVEMMNQNQTFGSVYDMYLKVRPGQEVIKRPLADGLPPNSRV